MRIIILFTAIYHASSAIAAWTIQPTTDPMTDATSYAVICHGSDVSIGDSMRYTPSLVLRITPSNYSAETDTMIYTPEVFFSISTDGLRRGTSQVMLRLDHAAPSRLTVTASTDRRAGFFATPINLMQQISITTNVLLRYSTTLGATRTTQFETSGLSNALIKIKSMYKQSLHHPSKNR